MWWGLQRQARLVTRDAAPAPEGNGPQHPTHRVRLYTLMTFRGLKWKTFNGVLTPYELLTQDSKDPETPKF